MSPEFAARGVMLLWLGAIGIVVYREFGDPNNIDKPFPRPCKLIPPSIGYTGLGVLAAFWPTAAFVVALGITIGEAISQAGAFQALLDQISQSISTTTDRARAAG